MSTKPVEYKGYSIKVSQDIMPENPFEAWDCEPPLLSFDGDTFKVYQGAPESLGELIRSFCSGLFGRHKTLAMLKEYLPQIPLRAFVEERQRLGEDDANTFIAFMEESYGGEPEGWQSAIAWFDAVESLLTRAGIPCYNGQSNGYTQGDSALVLAIASPAWAATVGAPEETLKAQCKGAFDLFSAWAWGDVYGIQEITDPEGKEVEDGSIWGFYGSDHEASGLMESARGSIDYHAEKAAKQYVDLEAALCSAE